MFSVLVLLGFSTIGADTTPSEPDPIVCKASKIAEVGTRMKAKPVCMRRSQWEFEQKVTERGLKELTDKGRHPGGARGR